MGGFSHSRHLSGWNTQSMHGQQCIWCVLMIGAYFLHLYSTCYLEFLSHVCAFHCTCLIIPEKPKSAAHSSTSATSTALPALFGWCLSALGLDRAANCHVWPLPHTNVIRASHICKAITSDK